MCNEMRRERNVREGVDRGKKVRNRYRMGGGEKKVKEKW